MCSLPGNAAGNGAICAPPPANAMCGDDESDDDAAPPPERRMNSKTKWLLYVEREIVMRSGTLSAVYVVYRIHICVCRPTQL